MAPLAAMVLGSVIRTVMTAVGAGVTVTSGVDVATATIQDPTQAAIGMVIMGIAQLWSIYQKKSTLAPVEERTV